MSTLVSQHRRELLYKIWRTQKDLPLQLLPRGALPYSLQDELPIAPLGCCPLSGKLRQQPYLGAFVPGPRALLTHARTSASNIGRSAHPVSRHRRIGVLLGRIR